MLEDDESHCKSPQTGDRGGGRRRHRAAGCQLVASYDLAIVSDRAQFCTPGVNLGDFCSTPVVALSCNMAPKHAMETLLTGETVDARTARNIVLVNRVVPPEYLAQAVRQYAETIAGKSASAIARGKRAFYRQLDMPLAEAYAYSSRSWRRDF